MSDERVRPPARALETVARALVEATRQHADLRGAIHELAAWLAEVTRSESVVEAGEHAPAPPDSHPVGMPIRIPIEPAAPYHAAPLVHKELRLGDTRIPMQVPAVASGIIEPADLTAAITGPTVVADAPLRRRAEFDTIALRCRLKAEACGWAALHCDALASRSLAPQDLIARDDLIRRAKSVDGCWLWMLDAGWLPDDRTLLMLCGENYACLALAAEIADRSLGDSPSEELMRLLAEAQSATRAALLQVGIENDSDQLDMFWWLRDLGQTHRIYIDRHMRRDDAADPGAWANLRARLAAWIEARDARLANDRHRGALLKKVEYHVKRLLSGGDDDADVQRRTILECLFEWTRRGFYPTDPLLCRTLLPVYEQIIEEGEERDDAAPILRAVDALAARQESQRPAEDLEPRRRGEEVVRAAELLRGRTVVLVGGDVRPLSKRRLERDLELEELRWLSTAPHERLDSLIPDIVRDDVDAVMLAIRLTSHSHGELADVCARAGKPFVRLPGGYGSAQVAHQVLEQISERLAPAVSSG